VNNASTDGTEEMLKKEYLNNPIFDYMRLNENLGGAGGFHYGIKRAYEKGFDWIWVMDDDAIPYNESVEGIKKEIKKDKRIRCFSSRVVDRKNAKEKSKVEKIKDIRFVGFGFNREIVKKIGLPREDFFIYFDDQEYADRIRKYFSIYELYNSLIFHQDWQERKLIKVLGFYNLPEIDLWRFYYRGRNQILRYSYFDYRKYLKIFWLIKDTILYSFCRISFTKIGFLALFHGIFGISGIKIKPGFN
jgi:GT2 family glycosyltransferase